MSIPGPARIRQLQNLRAVERQVIAVYVEESQWLLALYTASALVAIETELNCLLEEQERWREHESK